MALMDQYDLDLIKIRFRQRIKSMKLKSPNYYLDKYFKLGYFQDYTYENFNELPKDTKLSIFHDILMHEITELLDTPSKRLGSIMGIPIYESNLASELRVHINKEGRIRYGGYSGASIIRWGHDSDPRSIILIQSPTLKLPDFMVDTCIMHEVGHLINNVHYGKLKKNEDEYRKLSHDDELHADLFAAEQVGFDNVINTRRCLNNAIGEPKSGPYYNLVPELITMRDKYIREGKPISRKIDISKNFWRI
jgi:hypothetical protein